MWCFYCDLCNAFQLFKIFLVLRKHHYQIKSQIPSSQVPNGINLTLFKKTLSNLVFIIVWFILSYSFFLYTQCNIYIQGYSTSVIVFKTYYISIGIICLNSLINPIIYCWRLEDMRNGMKESFYYAVAKIGYTG